MMKDIINVTKSLLIIPSVSSFRSGGHIIGKAACENLCFSGSSFTSGKGTIRNPVRPLHSAGGSSGGSAALVLFVLYLSK